jgi:hypothetical protein
MTIILTTTDKRYTLWNVISFQVLDTKALPELHDIVVHHFDRPKTMISAKATKIEIR